jgi:hypothetical protein
VKASKGLVLDSEFSADITLTIQMPIDNFNGFKVTVIDISAGKAAMEIIQENSDTIFPFE